MLGMYRLTSPFTLVLSASSSFRTNNSKICSHKGSLLVAAHIGRSGEQPEWGKRPGIDRFDEFKEQPHKYNPMWSQGNLLEKPFSELLAFIVQQAEPEGQSLDLQKSTPFKLEWSLM